MAISQNVLREEASRVVRTESAGLYRGHTSAFLCHSHKDRTLALGLQEHLRRAGWTLYIDWLDSSMPDRPDRTTAETIQKKIVESKWFLFLATENSMASRWCPWELGYADGKKARDWIAIVPTSEGGRTHGNEYMALYNRIDEGTPGMGLFEAGKESGRLVRSL